MEATGPTGSVDVSGTSMGPTGSVDVTGPTGSVDVSGTSMGPTGSTEPVPDMLSLDDLLNDTTMKVAKEEEDNQTLTSIGGQSAQALRPMLLQWAKQGFPAAFPLFSIDIQPPALCSDGVSRNLEDYIVFCSGKSLYEHVQTLQAKLTGMSISFTNMGSYLNVVVSRV